LILRQAVGHFVACLFRFIIEIFSTKFEIATVKWKQLLDYCVRLLELLFFWYFNLFNLFDFLTYNCKKAIVVKVMAAQKLVWPRKRQKLTQTKKKITPLP
jgi:hypothetical protein